MVTDGSSWHLPRSSDLNSLKATSFLLSQTERDRDTEDAEGVQLLELPTRLLKST